MANPRKISELVQIVDQALELEFFGPAPRDRVDERSKQELESAGRKLRRGSTDLTDGEREVLRAVVEDMTSSFITLGRGPTLLENQEGALVKVSNPIQFRVGGTAELSEFEDTMLINLVKNLDDVGFSTEEWDQLSFDEKAEVVLDIVPPDRLKAAQDIAEQDGLTLEEWIRNQSRNIFRVNLTELVSRNPQFAEQIKGRRFGRTAEAQLTRNIISRQDQNLSPKFIPDLSTTVETRFDLSELPQENGDQNGDREKLNLDDFDFLAPG